MRTLAEKMIFYRGLGEKTTTGCVRGTEKNCESLRVTGEINGLMNLFVRLLLVVMGR